MGFLGIKVFKTNSYPKPLPVFICVVGVLCVLRVPLRISRDQIGGLLDAGLSADDTDYAEDAE